VTGLETNEFSSRIFSLFYSLLTIALREATLAPKSDLNRPEYSMGKLAGYIIFSNEQRPKVKAEFPKLKFGPIAKKIGKLWQALTPEERARYEEKAKNQ
jgi:hypothetical protein